MPSPGSEDVCKKVVELQGDSLIGWPEKVWCLSPGFSGGSLGWMLLPLGYSRGHAGCLWSPCHAEAVRSLAPTFPVTLL